MANLVFYPHVVGANMLTGQPGGASGPVVTLASNGGVVNYGASGLSGAISGAGLSDPTGQQQPGSGPDATGYQQAVAAAQVAALQGQMYQQGGVGVGVTTPSSQQQQQQQQQQHQQSETPPQQRRRSSEELRDLWRSAITQQILLNKMEQQNSQLAQSQNAAVLKRERLLYEELTPCLKQVSADWDQALLTGNGSAVSHSRLRDLGVEFMFFNVWKYI